MMRLLVSAIFLIAPLAVKASQASSVSTTAAPATHTITVGDKGQNAFVPNSVNANVGDTIVFQFYPSNHSVTKSEFGYPCIPFEDVEPGQPGFFSGFVPVDTGSANLPTWNITINDTQPLFYYCSAPGSCINNGMVGAINPNASTPVSAQIALAMQAKYMLQPGEPFPAEAAASATSMAAAETTVTATSTPSSTTTTTSSSTPTSTPAPASKKSGLSTGAIAGIAIGAVFLLALAGALFYLIGRNRTLQKSENRTQSTISAPMTYDPSTYNGPSSPLLTGQMTPATQSDAQTGRWARNLPPYEPPTTQWKHEDMVSVRSTSPPTLGMKQYQDAGAWMPMGSSAPMHPLAQQQVNGYHPAYFPGYFDANGQGMPMQQQQQPQQQMQQRPQQLHQHSQELYGSTVTAEHASQRPVGAHELGVKSPSTNTSGEDRDPEK